MSNENTFVGMQSGLSDQAQQMLVNFWPQATEGIKNLTSTDYKTQELPLARIKKIMKLDEDVKMISAEAPVLFAKAAEIFVSELSLRAWIHTEDNKRRTLQRNDIATAISKYDQFDFLIDIVPREELKPTKRADELSRTGSSLPEQIQYYLQLAQQQSQGQQQQQQAAQPAPQTQAAQPAQAAQIQTQTLQVSQAAPLLQQLQQANTQSQQAVNTTAAAQNATVQLQGGQLIQQQPFQIQQASQSQPQVIQLPQQVAQQVVSPMQSTVLQQLQQQQQQQQQQLQAAAAAVAQPQQQAQQQQAPAQVYQQVMNAQGQMENIPIQLTPQQLQAIQLQLQSKQIVVQQQQQQPQQQADQSIQFSQAQPMFQLQQAAGGQQQIFIQSGEEQTDATADS